MAPQPDLTADIEREPYTTGTGQTITVHSAESCSGTCPIHNPTDHHMREWPTHWRSDKGIMERICPHGIGHPDPDDARVRNITAMGIHGCDGCCRRGKVGRPTLGDAPPPHPR